jgi:hypothetical protein
VRTVAKRFVLGHPAPAERNYLPSRKPECAAFKIHDFKIAFNANGSVLQNSYFGCHLTRWYQTIASIMS